MRFISFHVQCTTISWQIFHTYSITSRVFIDTFFAPVSTTPPACCLTQIFPLVHYTQPACQDFTHSSSTPSLLIHSLTSQVSTPFPTPWYLPPRKKKTLNHPLVYPHNLRKEPLRENYDGPQYFYMGEMTGVTLKWWYFRVDALHFKTLKMDGWNTVTKQQQQQ